MKRRHVALLTFVGSVVVVLAVLMGLRALGVGMAQQLLPSAHADDAAQDMADANQLANLLQINHPGTAFSPPELSDMPKGPFGDLVRFGYRVFTQTPRYAGKYVGNTLSCSNCHLGAGRLADSAPLWAAWVSYPAFRQKNGHVNTYAERLQGCFRYSMNGTAPPLASKVMLALESYSFWMARKAPTGIDLDGRGYPKLSPPPQSPDYARGEQVYQQHCALCHQSDGQGQEVAGRTQFPPLWGPQSYNWGAGMHDLRKAAGFIKANMPLGEGGSLGDQQAWDVAMYVDSHERPQDPRFTGSVADTRKRFHDSPTSMYGKVVNGHLLGQGTSAVAARQHPAASTHQGTVSPR